MPLWNRFPRLTRVPQLESYLAGFLQTFEMRIPEPGRRQIRQGMIELANSKEVASGGDSDCFINTSFVACGEPHDWTGKPWWPIWENHQPDEYLCALLYGAIFKDVMIWHPYNWIAWRPDEQEFGIVRERRDFHSTAYGDQRLGEVMGLTYMRVAEPPEVDDDRAAMTNLLRTFESRRTR
jgi:hypothetical protein